MSFYKNFDRNYVECRLYPVSFPFVSLEQFLLTVGQKNFGNKTPNITPCSKSMGHHDIEKCLKNVTKCSLERYFLISKAASISDLIQTLP